MCSRSEVKQEFARLVIENESAHRHQQFEVGAVGAVPVRAFPMPPPLGAKLAVETIAQQRALVLRTHHDDAAAVASISARRPAARNELLPPEGKAAVAAVTRLYVDFGFINEHWRLSRKEAYDRAGWKYKGVPIGFGTPGSWCKA